MGSLEENPLAVKLLDNQLYIQLNFVLLIPMDKVEQLCATKRNSVLKHWKGLQILALAKEEIPGKATG